MKPQPTGTPNPSDDNMREATKLYDDINSWFSAPMPRNYIISKIKQRMQAKDNRHAQELAEFKDNIDKMSLKIDCVSDQFAEKDLAYIASVGETQTALEQLAAARAAVKELVEALEFYADDQNFLFMKEYGLLELGDKNIDLQGTNRIGEKARSILAKHAAEPKAGDNA